MPTPPAFLVRGEFVDGKSWVRFAKTSYLEDPLSGAVATQQTYLAFVGWVELGYNRFQTVSTPGRDLPYVVCFANTAQPNLQSGCHKTSHHVTFCEVWCDVENGPCEIHRNPLVMRVQRIFGFDGTLTDVTKPHTFRICSESVESSRLGRAEGDTQRF